MSTETVKLSEDDSNRALDEIVLYHARRFEEARLRRETQARREVGLELKFPVVDAQGRAASREAVEACWEVCAQEGWNLEHDSHGGQVTGARREVDGRTELLQTTTGYCVLELSSAPQPDLFALDLHLRELAGLARRLGRRAGVYLLGLGIQPLTPPGADLQAAKGRHLFWDQILPPRADTPHGVPGEVALFTAIADNQVHVDVGLEEAVPAVNLLNAVAGIQLALTANSTVWRGEADPRHVAVRELFWDWWVADGARCGMPSRPFSDFADYVQATVELRPVYAKREGQYLGLTHYPSFLAYWADRQARGRTSQGQAVALEHAEADLDLHDRAFWWNTRLSRFATLESRVSCQQPPGQMLAPAALVLGLVENREEAEELLANQPWERLRALRVEAAHRGLEACADSPGGERLVAELLAAAERGLRSRGCGEEDYLALLHERWAQRREPARQVREDFAAGGAPRLVEKYAWD